MHIRNDNTQVFLRNVLIIINHYTTMTHFICFNLGQNLIFIDKIPHGCGQWPCMIITSHNGNENNIMTLYMYTVFPQEISLVRKTVTL